MRLALIDSARAGTLGGIERALVSLGRHAAEAGHDVECAGRHASAFVAHAREAGLRASEVSMRGAWDAAGLLALARRFRAQRTDVSLVALNRDAQMAWLAGRVAGRPRVAMLKGLPMMRDRAHHRFLYRHCIDAVLAPTEWLRTEMLRYEFARGLRIDVLPDGVDENRFPPLAALASARDAARAAAGVGPGEAVFASVGHLVPRKNFAALPALLSRLPRGARWRWWVLGDGPERARIAESAAAHGISDRVEFLGRREDVPQWLLSADALLVPSLEEQLPLCILEARRAGVPRILVTPVGAVEDMRRLGARVEPLDPPGAWLEVMADALRHPGGCVPPSRWEHDDRAAQARRLAALERVLLGAS